MSSSPLVKSFIESLNWWTTGGSLIMEFISLRYTLTIPMHSHIHSLKILSSMIYPRLVIEKVVISEIPSCLTGVHDMA